MRAWEDCGNIFGRWQQQQQGGGGGSLISIREWIQSGHSDLGYLRLCSYRNQSVANVAFLVQVWMRSSSFFSCSASLLASRISYTGSISFKTTVIYSRGLGGGRVGLMWHVTVDHHGHRSDLTRPLLFLSYLPCEWCCFPRCSENNLKKKKKEKDKKKKKKEFKKKKKRHNPRLWVYSRPYRVETGPVLTPEHGPDRMTNKCMGVACRARL